jgi:hypothetical protein
MQSDFSVFAAHLAEASRLRKAPHEPLSTSAIGLHLAGVRALDVYRLAQIAGEVHRRLCGHIMARRGNYENKNK